MAINVNNGISNIQGTPGAYTGLFSTAPAANAVANGTLWFDPFGVGLYQSDGSSWVNYAGGGGPTPGIDSVLAVGQLLQNDRQIDGNANTRGLDFVALKNHNVDALDITLHNTNINTGIELSTGAFLGDYVFHWGIDIIQASGIYQSIIGDVLNNFGGTQINIIDQIGGGSILTQNSTYTSSGFSLDFSVDGYKFGNYGNDFALFVDSPNKQILIGDYNGNNNGTAITIDDNNQKIELVANNSAKIFVAASGIKCDSTTNQSLIGDIDSNINSSRFGVDDNNETLIATSNLVVTTSGSTSGKHLKINVSGIDYVIELKNP